MRHLLILLNCLTTLTLMTSAPMANASEVSPIRREPPPGMVKVLTYNIRYGESPDTRRQNLERIAEAINASQASVVALQEVDKHYFTWRSNCADQPYLLAKWTGMTYVYAAEHREPWWFCPGGPSSGGSVILSRHRIVYSFTHYLPDHAVALEAWINVNGTIVSVFNTHLRHNRNGKPDPSAVESRRSQADALASLLRARESSGMPFLLMGDFNAEYNRPEMTSLRSWPAIPHDPLPGDAGIDRTYYSPSKIQRWSDGMLDDPKPRRSDHNALWATVRVLGRCNWC